MFFFLLIGIVIGIFLDQEFKALPQLKPLFMNTLQKLQQGAETSQTESDTTNGVEKEN
jgi:hypothetical protein